jgi:hypothetical protein
MHRLDTAQEPSFRNTLTGWTSGLTTPTASTGARSRATWLVFLAVLGVGIVVGIALLYGFFWWMYYGN